MADNLIALHILKDLQDKLRSDDLALADSSRCLVHFLNFLHEDQKRGVCDFYWSMTKFLLGDEHAQIVYEMSIPNEVRDHTLVYGLF